LGEKESHHPEEVGKKSMRLILPKLGCVLKEKISEVLA
jgi:hypothetical protein